MNATSDYQRLGGEPAIRAMLKVFVDRIFDDVMIGFHFRDADRGEVHRLETEFACEFLGGPQRYSGRPLKVAHARHRIQGGQFMRRLKILDEVLEAHGVPGDIRARWRAHTEALRSQVTAQPGSECS